jgi:hypothetical protein
MSQKLVDSASFLSSLFNAAKIVRNKLNSVTDNTRIDTWNNSYFLFSMLIGAKLYQINELTPDTELDIRSIAHVVMVKLVQMYPQWKQYDESG